jgi:hypothetical protein
MLALIDIKLPLNLESTTLLFSSAILFNIPTEEEETPSTSNTSVEIYQ